MKKIQDRVFDPLLVHQLLLQLFRLWLNWKQHVLHARLWFFSVKNSCSWHRFQDSGQIGSEFAANFHGNHWEVLNVIRRHTGSQRCHNHFLIWEPTFALCVFNGNCVGNLEQSFNFGKLFFELWAAIGSKFIQQPPKIGYFFARWVFNPNVQNRY